MRITGGKWRGRSLKVPKGTSTRPTRDYDREVIFNVLQNSLKHDLGNILDLFAGSGSLSFEALSRGATKATMVEKDKFALAVIRQNAQNLDQSESLLMLITESKIENWANKISIDEAYATVFCDPPYKMGLVAKSLESLEKAENKIFADECILVVEQSGDENVVELSGWEIVKDRQKGASRIVFYKRKI